MIRLTCNLMTRWLLMSVLAVALELFGVSSHGDPIQAQTHAAPQPAPTAEASLTASNVRWMALSLREAMHLALQQNLDIQRDRVTPQIAAALVEQQRAAFDPLLQLVANLSQTQVLPESQIVTINPETGERSTTIIDGTFSKDGEVTPSLQQTIPLGSTYELSFVNTRSNIAPSSSGSVERIDDPRYDTSLTLTFSQPLLRDFGIRVNTTFIRQALKTLDIAEQQTLQTILNIIFSVQQRYWELVFRIQSLNARQAALELAKAFLAENQVKVDLNVLAPVELFQAERQVKASEANVVTAKAAVKTAEDLLKAVLNIPESEQTWQIEIRPTNELVVVPTPDLSEAQLLGLALTNRPDIRQSELDIESRAILRDFAQNQVLPRLDFVASGTLSAFNGNYTNSLGNLKDSDGYQWLIGLQLEYPLGNRFARRRLRQRRLELKQARLDQRVLQLLVATDVRQAIRAIESTGERVIINKATTRLAEQQLLGEQEKFEIGLSNSFRILQFQDQLTAARIDEQLTLADYHIALARLDLVTGTLKFSDLLEESP